MMHLNNDYNARLNSRHGREVRTCACRRERGTKRPSSWWSRFPCKTSTT